MMGELKVTRWPCRVSCYGNVYEADNMGMLESLLRLLVKGDLQNAAAYSAGARFTTVGRRGSKGVGVNSD